MFTDINVLLKEMEDFAALHEVPIINAQGRVIFIEAIKKYQPKKVLEIGTAIGYSALLTSHYSPNVKIKSFELSPQRIKEATEFINRSIYKNNIEIFSGDAAELIPKLEPEEKFDFIFIDAAKGQYPRYLQLVLPHLNTGGVIVADNVLFRDYVLGNTPVPKRFKTIVKRLREYISIVSEQDRFITKIYENGDGLAITQLKK